MSICVRNHFSYILQIFMIDKALKALVVRATELSIFSNHIVGLVIANCLKNQAQGGNLDRSSSYPNAIRQTPSPSSGIQLGNTDNTVTVVYNWTIMIGWCDFWVVRAHAILVIGKILWILPLTPSWYVSVITRSPKPQAIPLCIRFSSLKCSG